MSDEDKVVMICTFSDHLPPVPSVQRKCAECGKGVWVSLASLPVAEERKAVFHCWPCALPNIDEDSKMLPITPEQLKEIKENWGH